MVLPRCSNGSQKTTEEKAFLKSFTFQKSEIKSENLPNKKWEDQKPHAKQYQSRQSKKSCSKSSSYNERDRYHSSCRGRNDDNDNSRRDREYSHSPDHDYNAGQDRRGANGGCTGCRAFLFNG